MSSSRGEPSKKLPWLKKMDAQIAHENKLREAATRQIEGHKTTVVLPADKGGKVKAENLNKFAQFLEQAKIDKSRKQDRERNKQQQKKEESET